jgi:hypothetical protein
MQNISWARDHALRTDTPRMFGLTWVLAKLWNRSTDRGILVIANHAGNRRCGRRSALNRHAENETRSCLGGQNLQAAVMRLRDFRGDIQAQAKTGSRPFVGSV